TRVRYADLFTSEFGQPPHAFGTSALAALVQRFPIVLDQADLADRALLFDCLYTAALEPRLRAAGAVFVHDFPIELRAYARPRDDAPDYAARCELVVDGLELANGYHEVTDPAEQAACFAGENAVRA